VMEGKHASTPITTSPSKSGNDSWSKLVANKKLVITSAAKH
jgi:hypothetical protein